MSPPKRSTRAAAKAMPLRSTHGVSTVTLYGSRTLQSAKAAGATREGQPTASEGTLQPANHRTTEMDPHCCVAVVALIHVDTIRTHVAHQPEVGDQLRGGARHPAEDEQARLVDWTGGFFTARSTRRIIARARPCSRGMGTARYRPPHRLHCRRVVDRTVVTIELRPFHWI